MERVPKQFYTDEFREEVVALVVDGGLTPHPLSLLWNSYFSSVVNSLYLKPKPISSHKRGGICFPSCVGQLTWSLQFFQHRLCRS